MYRLTVKKDYFPILDPRETARAIGEMKTIFPKYLAKRLNLERITAPLIVTKQSGMNDDLSGVERKVDVSFKEMDEPSEVVQSLAKWKRFALWRYNFKPYSGLYTDMNAIRRDEEIDNVHSVFVDQWDWEAIITDSDRNLGYLRETAQKIVDSIADAQTEMNALHPRLGSFVISRDVHFVTAAELELKYPALTPQERENREAEKYGTCFIMQIGGKLPSGIRHGVRAPDYDDWNLNGDIIVWNDVLGSAFELSSMGIRVNAESLLGQLHELGEESRLSLEYHRAVMSGKYPLTIGGGIGQSRLSMLILKKLHIGEVQSGVWPKEMIEECKKHNIEIL